MSANLRIPDCFNDLTWRELVAAESIASKKMILTEDGALGNTVLVTAQSVAGFGHPIPYGGRTATTFLFGGFFASTGQRSSFLGDVVREASRLPVPVGPVVQPVHHRPFCVWTRNWAESQSTEPTMSDSTSPSVVPRPNFYLKTIQKQQDDVLEIRNQLSSLWRQSDFLRTVNKRLQQRLDRRQSKKAGGAA